jgi:hypothetical protein
MMPICQPKQTNIVYLNYTVSLVKTK